MEAQVVGRYVSKGMKIKAHLWILPRWFAAPLIAAPVALGAILTGGLNGNSWLAVLGSVFILAGAASFNTFLDYAWTGLDKGEEGERSAEKDYCGGQSLIARGLVSEKEVVINATAWYVLALIVGAFLAIRVGWQILLIMLLSMTITFWYSKAKFNWTHELSLAIGAGPLPVLGGMFSMSTAPPVLIGLLVSVPFAIIHSFTGLALDEWPDAEANLKKGVKSIAYKIWELKLSLQWYLTSWLLFMFLFQIFLISIGVLAPLSAISLLTWPFMLACMVLLNQNFRKAAGYFVRVATMYPILLVLGQTLGS